MSGFLAVVAVFAIVIAVVIYAGKLARESFYQLKF